VIVKALAGQSSWNQADNIAGVTITPQLDLSGHL
jgi:hypothetical protein